MKRVTIYVDEGDWEDVQRTVRRLSVVRDRTISAGNYLMDLHKANMGAQGSAKAAQPDKPHVETDTIEYEQIPDPAQKVKDDLAKITTNKKINYSTDSFFKPHSKDKQTGKKKGE